jgi:MFS family permease
VNYEIAGVWLAATPESSWRYVFLAGLAPVVLAFGVRIFIRESKEWASQRSQTTRAAPRELFRPGMVSTTVSGMVVAVTAILTWWACNAFLPILGATMATEYGARTSLDPAAARALAEAFKAQASNAFNIGGLLGTLAAIPLARLLGRRPMFGIYFLFSAAMLFATFGLDLRPGARLGVLYLVGAGVYGVFGAFPFYLPELFPAALRATGAGFCYNIGRVFAAAGPFLVGIVSAAAGGSSAVIIHTLFWLGLIPLAAASSARFLIVETRGKVLSSRGLSDTAA